MTNNDLLVPGSTSLATFLRRRSLGKVLPGVAALGFSTCLALLSISSQSPGQIVPNVTPGEFSSARALDHLQAIAAKPHPIGAPAHAEVRHYIVGELMKMGLEPQLQKTTAVNTRWGSSYRAATVQNIVAKLEGTANTRAVLLVAHYDAAPHSHGASDNGAAVVSLLETLRALKASEPLKNDVIFLATDGEEVGLLGAIAFVEQHPWARDVGVVLNFEARGDHGPSIMFQTSEGNGWLIEEFAQTVREPVANSLSAGRCEGHAYMIESYIAGDDGRDSPGPKLGIWRELGKYAKLIHSIGVYGFGETLSDITKGDARKSWLLYLESNIENLTENDPLIKLKVLTPMQSKLIRDAFGKLRGREFTFGLNHGDFSLRNTVVDHRGRVHLLDWGSADAGIVPHHDLIEMLLMNMVEGAPEEAQIRAFLDGYGISPAEFKRMTPELESMLVLRVLNSLRWALDSHAENLDRCVFHARLCVSYLSRAPV